MSKLAHSNQKTMDHIDLRQIAKDGNQDLAKPPCPDCESWHDGGPCGHDRTRDCQFCTRPVGPLSTGGPGVCVLCEVVGVPPSIFMGLEPPRDFHTPKETPNE